MKYIYKMSRKMFYETLADAKEAKMSVTQYVTKHFGLRGECVKVEIL